jgi:prevent-host-death family protein
MIMQAVCLRPLGRHRVAEVRGAAGWLDQGVCYICYMAAEEARIRVITHRELRNNSSEVLRAVQGGEIIEVTNHGSAAAILVPPSLTPYERLVAAGKVREPLGQQVDLRRIRRTRSATTTGELIADLRGDR